MSLAEANAMRTFAHEDMSGRQFGHGISTGQDVLRYIERISWRGPAAEIMARHFATDCRRLSPDEYQQQMAEATNAINIYNQAKDSTLDSSVRTSHQNPAISLDEANAFRFLYFGGSTDKASELGAALAKRGPAAELMVGSLTRSPAEWGRYSFEGQWLALKRTVTQAEFGKLVAEADKLEALAQTEPLP
jgi:hypothetical protein